MSTILQRRMFLKGMGAATLALGLRRPRLQSQSSNHFLMVVFLRGAADALSILHPNASAGVARTKFNTWRPTTRGIRVPAGQEVAVGSTRFATHPALADLISGPFQQGNLAFVGGAGGPVLNLSHFRMMDLIESGTDDHAPLATGYLGRASEALGLSALPLGRVALNPHSPYALLGEDGAGLAIPDPTSFSNLSHPRFEAPANRGLKERLEQLYPDGGCSNAFCVESTKSVGAVQQLSSLPAGVISPTNLIESVENLGLMVDANPSHYSMATLDIGGWDHHTNLKNRVADMLRTLNSTLMAIHQAFEARIAAGTATVVVMTEFGRRIGYNGSDGADHGHGSVALVFDGGLRKRLFAQGYFPGSAGHAFYAGVNDARPEDSNVPKGYEIRHLLSEIFMKRFGLNASALSTIFPNYTMASPNTFLT